MFNFFKIAWKMAFHPRKGMQERIITNPMSYFYLLASLSIIHSFFVFARAYFVNFSAAFFVSLAFIIPLSPFLGALIFNMEAYVLRFVGNKWLDGTAPASYIKACVAWASLPSLLNLIYVLVLLIGFPNYFFEGIYPPALTSFQMLLNNGIMIWSLIILMSCLAEAQQFTIGKAIGNFLLYFLLIFVVIFLVVLLGLFFSGLISGVK